MQERRFNTKIAAILILALGVRVLGIVSRPIWYDEAFSILFSEKGLGAMLFGTLAPTGTGSADIHPLGYYTALWVWMKFLGQSLFAVRLLSIIPGIVSVYLIYLIALEALSDVSAAHLSMLFTALAPFQIHYSQEIRMYSFLGMWLLLATYAYQRGSKTGSWRWWIVFSISAALAQYTHNLAAFYLTMLALLPIFKKDWKSFSSVALAGTGAMVVYFPWLIQLPAQFSKVQSAYWVERPDVSKLFTLLLVYITHTPLPLNWIPVALSATLLIVILAGIQTIHSIRQPADRAGLWLLYLSFGAPLLLFLFSQWRAVYIERALLPSGAIFCIWLAWALTRTHLPKVAQYGVFALLGFSSVLGMYQHLTYHDAPYGPFKELDLALRQRVEPQDVILHSNKLSMLPAVVFDRDLPQSFIGDPPGGPTDTLAVATQKVLGIQAEESIQSATETADRVWYIIYERSIAEYQAAGHKTHPDLEYLDSHFILETKETWDGLQVFLYTRKP